jgi:diguanylate cyclase (GGDEF)-like protein/PAS domain S-box-containing protein
MRRLSAERFDGEDVPAGGPPGPLADPGRLASVARFAQLPPHARVLQSTVAAAARSTGAPLAELVLVHADSQQVLARFGGPPVRPRLSAVPSIGFADPVRGLDSSICQHVVLQGRPVSLPDVRLDPREQVQTTGRLIGFRAYLGVPLTDDRGNVLGALCAMDAEPREWTPDDVAVLRDLADVAVAHLVLREQLSILRAVGAREQAVIAVEADGTVVAFTPAVVDLIGWQAEEALGIPITTLLSLGSEQPYLAALARAFDAVDADAVAVSARLRHRDGRAVPMQARLVRAEINGRVVVGAHLVPGPDASAVDADLRALAEATSAFVATVDADGRVVTADGALLDGLGWRADLAPGADLAAMLAGQPELGADLARARSGTRFSSTRRYGARRLQVHWRPTTVSPEAPGPCGLVLVVVDVTERATPPPGDPSPSTSGERDPVTGALTARAFERALTEALVPERGRTLLAMLDLSAFRDLNRTFGNAAGDGVLREVATRLAGDARAPRLVARAGGDAFLVALPLGGEVDAPAQLAALRALVERPHDIDGTEVPMSAAIGWTQLPGEAQQALAHLDTALARARRLGAGSTARYHRDLDRAGVELAMASRLRRALDTGAVRPVFQPIRRLTDGRQALWGFEALARWTDPELGPVRPDVFVALAEHTGLVADLGRQILDASLAEMSRWPEDRVPHISVNMSPLQLFSHTFVDEVLAALRVHDLPPHRLVLELTESALMGSDTGQLDVLQELAATGVRIAMDDFGVGHSSLARLRDLPVAIVKIDRSFVSPLPDPRARQLVSAFSDLAAALGLDVVAEGIETVEQRDALTAVGCELGQGWLLGRPGPLTQDVPARLT